MHFELLPNETILDLFEYLSISDLFHGLFNLNTRFNELLCIKFQKYHLDLRLLSKTSCLDLCENYIPLIIDRIISLHLSNDFDTSQQIELFLSQHFQFRQFIHLQSLALTSVRSEQLLEKILTKCSSLPCLTHLTITDSYLSIDDDEAEILFKQIWNLNCLTHCHLNIEFYGFCFSQSASISTSIRYLTIKTISCSFVTLCRLYQKTPNLKSLSINMGYKLNLSDLSSCIFHLTRLNVQLHVSANILEHFLQTMPDLLYLSYQSSGIYTSGYQWEQIIRTYLPKLKGFSLKTMFSPLNNKSRENQLDEIVDLYRSQFWINEKKWFIQCYWCKLNDEDRFDRIELFTLPYECSTFFDIPNYILVKSTSPINNQYLICDHVTELCYKSSSFTSSLSSCIRFPNLQHLELELPLNNQFFSVIPTFDQLTSIYFYKIEDVNSDLIQSQLQLLFNRSTHLRSLYFDRWSYSIFQRIFQNLTNNSIDRLDLCSCLDDQYLDLNRIPIGKQCRTLLIKINDKKNVFNLLKNMSNLQSLIIEYQDNEWSIPDLPSTYLIHDSNEILSIWIR